MSDLGKRVVASILEFDATFSVNGVPTDFASTPTVSVYKAGSTAESTSGVTVTQPYDSRTGLCHVKIDTSSDGSFYAADNDFSAIVTVGTVAGVSMVGCVIASFRLTVAETNLNEAARSVPRGTVTTGGSTTSVPTSALSLAGSAASGVVSNQFVGRSVVFDGDTTTAGLRGVASAISASSASNTPTLTVATLPATPVSGDTFVIE
jgi:hypothetical protein